MPAQIKPMLAKSDVLPRPRGGEFAYEFKWDGVRAIVFVEPGRVRVMSRNNKDLTTSFPELREIGAFLESTTAILDGEIVAVDDAGRPSFGQLQQRLHLASRAAIAQRAREFPASFLAFDLLYLDGHSTTDLSYDQRRALLEDLKLEGPTFATPPAYTDVSAEQLLAVSREQGLEGIVAKRRSAPYGPGQRNGAWVKLKNFRTQVVVIGGFTEGRASRAGSLGALLVGLPAEHGLEYAGKVGTGFDARSRSELLELLGPLTVDRTPFMHPLGRAQSALARFVEPVLVGEVRFGEWTSDGRLRHPSWRGLRPDKEPREVVRER